MNCKKQGAYLYVALLISLLTSISGLAQSRIALFNGEDLTGWSAWNRKGDFTSNADERFEVSEQMIRMHGTNGGYLMTDSVYENYELTLEFRWNIDSMYLPQKEKKNSGVMYNVPLDAPNSWFPRGVQFQVQSEKTGDFILLKEATLMQADSLYGPSKSVVVTRYKSVANEVGEWNQIRIVSKNGELSQYLNGTLVNQGRQSSEVKGKILLCYENAPIDFRYIYILLD